MIRAAFTIGANRASRALERHVPAGVSAQLDQHYDVTDKDAYLDVFHPSGIEGGNRSLPAVIWVHGGGWVSGDRKQIANYARIIASRGCTVVAVGYSIAPGSIYPAPVRQINAALSYLVGNASRLHVNPSLMVLAGDSAGAHIVVQLANAVKVPPYAGALGVVPSIAPAQLAGLILYCGPYDFKVVNRGGPYGWFMRIVLRAYSGKRRSAGTPLACYSRGLGRPRGTGRQSLLPSRPRTRAAA